MLPLGSFGRNGTGASKGQGLPLNTIIVAIIVIVVLVVIILIFTGQIGGIQDATEGERACQAIGGTCVTPAFCEMIGSELCGDTDTCGDGSVCMVR